MLANYETDVIAWANEQARFIRAGRFDLLDLENIAEEIEDVGKAEKRELESRMAVLLAHLLKWQFQPERRGASWTATIRTQRKHITRRIEATPSLKPLLQDSEWFSDAWGDAVVQAYMETGLEGGLPEVCGWSLDEILGQDWLPN